MSGRVGPPPLATALLTRALAPADRDPVVGDLAEAYGAVRAASSRAAADRWYRRQAWGAAVRLLPRRLAASPLPGTARALAGGVVALVLWFALLNRPAVLALAAAAPPGTRGVVHAALWASAFAVAGATAARAARRRSWWLPPVLVVLAHLPAVAGLLGEAPRLPPPHLLAVALAAAAVGHRVAWPCRPELSGSRAAPPPPSPPAPAPRR